jgi:hypothetical protein
MTRTMSVYHMTLVIVFAVCLKVTVVAGIYRNRRIDRICLFSLISYLSAPFAKEGSFSASIGYAAGSGFLETNYCYHHCYCYCYLPLLDSLSHEKPLLDCYSACLSDYQYHYIFYFHNGVFIGAFQQSKNLAPYVVLSRKNRSCTQKDVFGVSPIFFLSLSL